MIADTAQRAEALDIDRSFCVTAPAGSGKTELLIQRFLALLTRVNRPEQVLAITFTRKAAAEMLERVLQALWAAESAAPVDSEHQQRTRDLALAALAHGRAQGWALSRDIGRFNIRTIDGFCAALARQMPILSRFGGQARPVDDADYLYRLAVGELFSTLGSARAHAAALDALLLHFDNDWGRLENLLVGMLAKREQWQDYVAAGGDQDAAEARLRRTVQLVIEEELESLVQTLAPWLDQILDLLAGAQASRGVAATVPSLPLEPAQLPAWRALKPFLLTTSGSLRKTVTVREGFPVKSEADKARKAQMLELLQVLAAEVPDLPLQLQRLGRLPDMDDHAEAWQLVLHLSHVLPLLSACLLLVFEREGAADHTQVALAALDALGEDDAPTELALRLDYQIEHILVDEFQDTALNQYRLVQRLTRGWEQHNVAHPEAPRTLFIVGDGMQSIYGFRNANVGLFLRARQEGFNGVIPQLLALQCNFRSTPGIVDWVNTTFAEAFPAEDDPRRGSVRFTAAQAVRPAGYEPAVDTHAFVGDGAADNEALWLAGELEAAVQQQRFDSIAVLGRSRGQLAPLLAELRRRGVAFAAQDMDSLASSPAIVDLLTLCRALANPGDRVAWLALLRAPWCGLTLDELHALAGQAKDPRRQNLAALLLAGELPAILPENAAARLARLRDCLRWAWAKRDRLALRVWVEQCWRQLGGPACLENPMQLEDAARFFDLLQDAEREGVGLDIAWLEQKVTRLFASGGAPDAALQIMTLHKAKGLEFDWVVIPALARAPRSDDRQLLLWDDYTAAHGEGGFLLAADDHSEANTPGLYNYLKGQRSEKQRNESARLLYVGATRAAQRLTLSACLKTEGEEGAGELRAPGDSALLSHIWPAFQRGVQIHEDSGEPADTVSRSIALRVLRNPPQPEAMPPQAEGPNIPEPVLNRVERHVGTAIHLMLERLSLVAELPEQPPAQYAELARQCLAQLGLHGSTLGTALETVLDALRRTLADPQGRWLLDAAHPEAHSEFALTWQRDGAIRDIVIDRCFVDAGSGERWIIDYKSSVPPAGVSLDTFIAGQAQAYTEQLAGYRDALRALGDEPLRCALYFPRLGVLHRLTQLDT
ncbi:DNA helicase UvrD [Mangrovimicrobium sediminis]|uniref:DNA 3'-5' helicase n=1 Tax=Mangrovimicrobium sediminis TaxID=2562682 RepID=A0A4Z0M749_9GAMM|nr:UvrD-helicase domain-containing protein [Haliea sp. SAOS-164]TGD75329.1 DNA helicase UvrD [Haliea sp. SAOS-164]